MLEVNHLVLDGKELINLMIWIKNLWKETIIVMHKKSVTSKDHLVLIVKSLQFVKFYNIFIWTSVL